MRAPRCVLLCGWLLGCSGNVVVDGTNAGGHGGVATGPAPTSAGGGLVVASVGSGGAPGTGGSPATGGFGGVGGAPATTTDATIASTTSATIASSAASGGGCVCPDPGDSCTQPVCMGATCVGNQPAPPGTKCGASGTKFCDGAGRCLDCMSAADCGFPQSPCDIRTCVNGSCKYDAAPAGTQCGPHSTCNGEDCFGCRTLADCPAPPPCGIEECMPNGYCIVEGNTVDTPCSRPDGSAGFCRAGVCVECDSDGDCPAPNLCIGQRCHPQHCKDHALDADETDVDCGGSCGGCGRNKKCFLDRDCKTNHCYQGTCR